MSALNLLAGKQDNAFKSLKELGVTVERQRIALALLILDGGTQSRDGLSREHVANLKEALEMGVELPAINVVFDGVNLYPYDGFHRIEAHKQAGHEYILARVEQGTHRDAILKSCGANPDHGLPRTGADKRRAVVRLLEDTEWAKWSNVEIARRCVVSDEFVRKVRAEHFPPPTVGGETRTFTHKTGTVTTMNVPMRGKVADPAIPRTPTKTIVPNSDDDEATDPVSEMLRRQMAEQMASLPPVNKTTPTLTEADDDLHLSEPETDDPGFEPEVTLPGVPHYAHIAKTNVRAAYEIRCAYDTLGEAAAQFVVRACLAFMEGGDR